MPAKYGTYDPRVQKESLTARTADKHRLYEASVQGTDADIRFMERVFKKTRRCVPLRLREDFCGTARMSTDWVQSHPARTAVGVDLHRPTLAWAKRHHLQSLGRDAKRVQLRCANVLNATCGPVDVAVAFNFSYCALKSRLDMLTYASKVYEDLVDGGAFFLDIHGGTESFEEGLETTQHPGFTYVWDQEPYDPIGGFAKRHIHFGFSDGTQLKRAFSYDWRLWSLPELRDILLEIGFSPIDVYWEGADPQHPEQGNGIFRKIKRAQNDLCWVAYMVAWRGM